MDEIPVTRIYLETLTTRELVRIADSWGIDVPPDLDRIFIIEELLDAAALDAPDAVSDESALSAEPEMEDVEIKEAVPLPKQYNISFIEVMIRDPLWAFVFWEVKGSDREQYEKSQDFGGYYLKVSSACPGLSSPPAETAEGAFTVPVKPGDSAWYLGLNPTVENGIFMNHTNKYKVELCAAMKGEEIVILCSIPFSLPGLPENAVEAGGEGRSCGKNAEYAGAWENPLVNLSGYADFHVLRNSERALRSKKGLSAD